MRSFYFKNFLFTACLILISYLILGTLFVGIGQGYMLRERQRTIQGNAIELSRLATAYDSGGALESWDFRITLSSIAESTGNLCFVVDGGGEVTLCSDRDLGCGHVGRSVDPGVMEALARDGFFTGVSSLGGLCAEKSYVAALPVFSSDGIRQFIFVVANLSGILRTWRSLLGIFLISAVVIMTVLLVICYVTGRVQGRPVQEMAAAAVRFAHGDFSARVSAENRDDELGALADSFNQMAESLERSEKRRSDFIANVAHELKTPMTTISGFADGILDGTIPPERERQYLETISSETKRLNRLVRNMLDVSRVQGDGQETLRKKSFDITDLLARTLVVFEGKINSKRLEVNALLPEDPILVCGDADAINQVIYNLLENAVKFADPGTELGVSLFKQNDKAYVSIRNHGAEIPPEDLPLIFDRFHKADRSRSEDRDGYGLGLYIVKTILHNHGEDIAVTSRDGVTEFVFSLTLKEKREFSRNS